MRNQLVYNQLTVGNVKAYFYNKLRLMPSSMFNKSINISTRLIPQTVLVT